MKSLRTIAKIFIFLFLLISISLYSFTRETKDWEFIQKVGGIKTGTPIETEDGLYLPVLCDESGTDSITLKTRVSRKDSIIHLKIVAGIPLKVITGISFGGNDKCYCRAVKIGHLKRGNYTVYYGKKSSFAHPIGKFTVE